MEREAGHPPHAETKRGRAAHISVHAGGNASGIRPSHWRAQRRVQRDDAEWHTRHVEAHRDDAEKGLLPKFADRWEEAAEKHWEQVLALHDKLHAGAKTPLAVIAAARHFPTYTIAVSSRATPGSGD